MNFTLTCKNCLYQMTLDLSNLIEQYPCLNCQEEIPIRVSSMGEGVSLNEQLSTLYEINDDGFSKLFVSYDKTEGQLCLTRVFDETFFKAVCSPEEIKDIMEASSSLLGDTHPAILHSDYFEKYLYQVMPYMKLESIDQIVENDYLWSPLQGLDLCHDILESLDNAYSVTGCGHFNLNPHNIFINNDGSVKFIGFTLAPQLLQDPRFISSDFNIFDIYYSSPELVQGLHYPKQSSDLYSLGHCLYYMMTGLTPHGAIEDKSELVYEDLNLPDDILESLDEEFLQIFKTMTNKDHNHRYQSYRQTINAIEQYYNSIGHVQLKQMEGEKTLLFQSQHFIQHVLPNVQKKPKSLTIKSKSNYNSEVIRQKVSTQIHLPKEFKTKITHAHASNKRRLQQRPHSQMLNRSKSAGKIKQSRNRLSFAIILIAFIAITFSLLNSEIFSSNTPNNTPIPARDNEKPKASIQTPLKPLKSHSENTIATPDIDYQWYKNELKSDHPNFDQLNLRLIEDIKLASSDELKELMLIQEASHEQLFTQKNRILNQLNEQILALLQDHQKEKAINLIRNYSAYIAQHTSSERAHMVQLIEELPDEKAFDTPKDEFELLALQIMNTDIDGAIISAVNIENSSENKNIQRLRQLLLESKIAQLYKTIFSNILSSEEPVIPVPYLGKIIDTEFNSYNLEKQYISVKSYINNRNLNLEIPFDKLNNRFLATWLNRSDKDEQVFLRFMFLLHVEDYTGAFLYLHPYQGPLATSLKPLFQKVLNSEMTQAYTILFENFHQKFGSEMVSSSMDPHNQIALYTLITELQNQYQLIDFSSSHKELITNYLTQLENTLLPRSSKEIIVGHDSQYKLPRLAHALKNKNTTIRLLPGIYTEQIQIDQVGTTIIACNGVQIHSDISVNASSCSLEYLNLNSGSITLAKNINSVQIKNTNLMNGSIDISAHNESITIDNCILNGISFADSAKKINIQDSLIFPNKDSKSNVSGSPQRTQFLNCIFTADNTPIFKNFKKQNDIKFRYCLFSSEYFLAINDPQKYTTLTDLRHLFPQFNFCLQDQLTFVNSDVGDYRLSPQSPGYKKGYKKFSIGVKMNDHGFLTKNFKE
ncbi:protein kinase [Lentisphaera marina]|uniref:protein kinase domain-containing protein n=1 Tax=Lentisphaera marina TaxID=1111041 RepID=UPI002365F984|nr:protein kinase [Lentisphaera marina]MDD7986855.1 protein kinase [Lentisphaera marina]